MRRIRLLLATFVLVGTAFFIGLSQVMAQEEVVQVQEDVDQEDVDQEEVVEDEVDQEEVVPDEVVLFDAAGNAVPCSSVDINADGESELLCVPQTTPVETATDEEEEAAEEAAEDE